MTEPQTPEAKDIKTSGGNYNEQIGKHYIHAETVNIYETAPNLSEPSKHNGKVIASQKQLAFAIAGSVNEVDQSKLKAILALLQKISGDASIEIIRVEEGSIRIILNGSDEGLERINELFESGELTEVLGTAVEYVELTELDEKSRLIQDIFHNGASSQNLSNADLSGADLSYANLSGANLIIADLSRANLSRANLSRANLIIANLIIANLISADLSGANLISANLSGADLSGADLSGANLSGANLSGANLSGADLSGANLSDSSNEISGNLRDADLILASMIVVNLSGANLSGANLSGANLSGANLSGANIENARFGNNQGLSESIKRELIQRGAIFEDSSGDHSRILLPK